MRRPLVLLAAVCGLLAGPAPRAADAPAGAAAAPATAPLQARVIVKLRSDGALVRAQAAATAAAARPGPQLAAELGRRVGWAMLDGRPLDRDAQLVLAEGIGSEALAARLAADPEVEYAEPDRRRHAHAVPNDPLYPGGLTTTTPAAGQWYLRPPAAGAVSAINAEQAWDITTGASSVVVAVLDTGVRRQHPDLAGKLHAGYDFVTDPATANDGDGRDADPGDPGDWLTQAQIDANPAFVRDGCTPEDSSWHGTQVAGLVGAVTDNGFGMASVGRNVMVLPVRVLGRCGGFDSDIQDAMRWAGGISSVPFPNPTPAKVINLSLGGPGACSQRYREVVAELTAIGVTVVASAGNERGHAVSTPANCPGVIAVGGVRNVGTKVGFSDVGPEITLTAPGGNCGQLTGPCLFPILTTTNAGATTPGADVFTDSGARASLGTSFSAPLVAGTVALMLSVRPDLGPAQLGGLLRETARPFPPPSTDPRVPVCHAPDGTDQDECHCTTSTCGAGLLDAHAAVAAAAGVTVVAPPVVDTGGGGGGGGALGLAPLVVLALVAAGRRRGY